jgi:hypothetical protein
MKKTLLTLALTAVVASTAMAQGFVIFSNPGNEKISVNSTVGGPATGAMPLTSTYYFALFYSASATTVLGSAAAVTGAGNYVFNDPNWTFDNPTAGQAGGYVYGPGYGQNVAAGQFTSSYIDPTQSGTLVPFTTAAQFVVVGWSAAIGTNITQVAQWLAAPGVNGWIGESIVSAAITPGNPNGTPPTPSASLFSTTAGLLQKFTLGEVAASVPEPTTIALFGLGGLALLAFRRRQ